VATAACSAYAMPSRVEGGEHLVVEGDLQAMLDPGGRRAFHIGDQDVKRTVDILRLAALLATALYTETVDVKVQK
jgi:hypothetical protein